ncbi:VWA domain-containing protein [Staphylococcus chromogenes]|nr:VWA domain-containing protein [Staphylococcus chromogenes]
MKRTFAAWVALGIAVLHTPIAAAESATPIMLVIDASGSMEAQDAGGKTRMAAAKEAGRAFVDEAGNNAELGLVTYGSKVGNDPSPKEQGCKDIDVVSSPKKGNGRSLRGKSTSLNQADIPQWVTRFA